MSPPALEKRIQEAPPHMRRQIQQFLDAPEPQRQVLAAVLSERGTQQSKFLTTLLRVGLAASGRNTRWPDFDDLNDLSAVVQVLTQPAVVEEFAPIDPLAVHRLKGMLVKQQLLNYQGQPPLTSEQVSEVLGMSREAINKRRKNQQLVAVSLGKRGYRYPAWQFQEGKVLPGLKEVLQVLNAVSEWTPLLFLCSGDPRLNGETPLERLQAGDISAVVAAARCYGQAHPI
jgi:hypothetical protein